MICKVFCITPGTVEDCIARLKDGHLLCIAPGGVREALFSDPSRYNIMWGRRLGFAKVVVGADTVRLLLKSSFTASINLFNECLSAANENINTNGPPLPAVGRDPFPSR